MLMKTYLLARVQDGLERGDSPGAAFPLEDEAYLWAGLKTLRLRRTSQGFGFTLRHFIVYPPESAVQASYNVRRQRNRLEPMDTIFVKQVKEGGPAHGAGLCTGDRIVKVNDESIIGKTYSQVIALIQHSDAFLDLCVMPKDEDILQLAYSQDAYLKGHDPYNGNASRIPKPPPVCYPQVDCKSPPGMVTENSSSGGLPLDVGYRLEIPVPPSPPCVCSEGARTVAVPPDLHMGCMSLAHRGDYGLVTHDPVLIRGRPGTVSGGRPSYPLPRQADVFPPGAGYHRDLYAMQPAHYPQTSSVLPLGVQQNIDWRTYQTYREYIDHKGLHTYGRTIQERLDSLRAASQASHLGLQVVQPHPSWDTRIRRRSTSHDRSASQDRMTGMERAAQHRDWPRSASQDALMRKVRGQSTDYVERGEPIRPSAWPTEQRTYSRAEQQVRPTRQSLPSRSQLYRPAAAFPDSVRTGRGQVLPASIPPVDRPSRLRKSLTPEPAVHDQRVLANHAHHLHPQRTRADTAQPPDAAKDARAGPRFVSYSAPPSNRQPQSGVAALRPPSGKQAAANRCSPTEGVVLREKPPPGKNGPQPLRHPSYILAVNEAEEPGGAGAGAVCWLPNDARREFQMLRLGDKLSDSFCSSNLDESLDSIPFIDEPASPSIDRDATPISAVAVISIAPTNPAASLSPTSSSPLIRRQLSHDQESLRNATLDQLNGGKAERSKSYDEAIMEVLFKRIALCKQAVDGHKSSEDSGSRRDSSSDVFSDSSKEGWLHFRQLNTDKNKRVGGGIRAWKQMYVVLQGHSLYLYKDKKEALAHAHSHAEDTPQPISIKACLIDISYSDTKRKNVLRLTTSDCEYLFQAEGRDDMLCWIRVIQENSNLDEEVQHDTTSHFICVPSAPSKSKSQSPHSPKHEERKSYSKDESSPVRDRTSRRMVLPGLMRKPFEKKQTAGVTFGVRLDNCPPAQTNRFVPLIVEVCCKLVEERGLEYTGIYRVPGNNAAISSMQEELDTKGMDSIDIQDDKWRDLNVISSLLKSFFRKLPEPLFTNEKYADFIEANRTADATERLKELKRLIHELPDHHYETLKFLSGHLKMVSENCEKNKMEPRNLAIVFGPTLVRTSEDNMTHMVTHMPDQYKIVETLIQQYDWFFTDDGDGEPTTVLEQESTVQSQPIPNIDHLLTNIGRTAPSPGEVSDSATSDSAKSKGSWGSGKDQYSRELLRSSIFASRKRKKAKDKPAATSSDDDLDAVFSKKDLQETEPEAGEAEQPHPLGPALTADSSPRSTYRMQPARQSSLSDPPSAGDDGCTSDLGTLNSSSSHASGGRAWPAARTPGEGAAEICSITSDYSTTSSMTFLTVGEGCAPAPEAGEAAESRGGDDDADDERSELVSEGRPMDTDSESDLSVFAAGRKAAAAQESAAANPDAPQEATPTGLVASPRIIACDTLARKKSGASRQKTDSESSAEGGRGDRPSRHVEAAKGRSTGSLSSSSRSSEHSECGEPAWRLKITDRLKLRLRSSADDMFGIGRSPETRSRRRSNIRRRHTMGGQRDFAELAVLGDWPAAAEGAELSAVHRLKPKCSSQDFSIRDWIVRERHRASNPEVALDAATPHPRAEAARMSPAPLPSGDAAPSHSKNLSLASDAHPHKLSGSQVVRSRFYQYL
uniref:Uncharacterized protein n=1 Tax=Denticeps clupeoides TaxID=299321 RepID=A0AAY4CIT5_9TELE